MSTLRFIRVQNKAIQHSTRRVLTSDWFVNSFIIVVHEKISLKFSQKFLSKVWLKYFLIDNHYKTSGIHGGYRLVSTYDIPDPRWGGYSGTLRFGLSDNFHFGGYSGTLGFGLWQFSFGGVFWTLGFGLSDNFHWGGGILGHSGLDSLTIFIEGVFWDTRIWTLWQFPFGGVFWDTRIWTLTIFIWGGILGHSDLDSLTIFIGEGVFWDTRVWTLWQFSLGGILGHSDLDTLTIFIGGGVFCTKLLQNRVFCGIWTKISTTPAGSCITDSLSHTTYVETNYLGTREHSSRMCTARFSGRLFGISWGVSAWGGLSRGCVCWGVSAQGGVCHTSRGQTDACENITLPQTSFSGGNQSEVRALPVGYSIRTHNWYRELFRRRSSVPEFRHVGETQFFGRQVSSRDAHRWELRQPGAAFLLLLVLVVSQSPAITCIHESVRLPLAAIFSLTYKRRGHGLLILPRIGYCIIKKKRNLQQATYINDIIVYTCIKI